MPGRVISDNIILNHELVKGYTRKSDSARCMLKIDIRKVSDSKLFGAVLIHLNFPDALIQWIMKCIYL